MLHKKLMHQSQEIHPSKAPPHSLAVVGIRTELFPLTPSPVPLIWLWPCPFLVLSTLLLGDSCGVIVIGKEEKACGEHVLVI